MSSPAKKDNSFPLLKARIRRAVAADMEPGDQVLELFSGSGKMFRMCWSGFVGATMDLDESKADLAAKSRGSWACYHGDSEKALGFGWMSHVPFRVVDVDAYGEPWKFFLAWLQSDRERAPVTDLVLTDGYLSRASIATCTAIFGKGSKARSLSKNDYMQIINDKLPIWLDGTGLDIDRFKTWFGGAKGAMAAHLLRLRRTDTPRV